MKILSLIILSLFLSSCSSPKAENRRAHRNYLKKVQLKKEQLQKAQYRYFLKKEIEQKNSELTSFRGIQDKADKRIVLNEGAGQDYSNPADIHQFKANSAKIEMKRTEDKINIIKKQIFFLKSQLSAISGD